MNDKPLKIKEVKPGQQIPVDLKNAAPVYCKCGGKYFIQRFEVFNISAIASPVGQELTVFQPTYLCADCGAILTKEEKKLNG